MYVNLFLCDFGDGLLQSCQKYTYNNKIRYCFINTTKVFILTHIVYKILYLTFFFAFDEKLREENVVDAVLPRIISFFHFF